MRAVGDLTEVERALLDAAVAGDVLDVTGRPTGERRVRADVIYELCVVSEEVHASGVRVKGAIIEESIDLGSATLRVPLLLDDCTVGDPDGPARVVAICVDRAVLRSLFVFNSRIHGSVSGLECRSDHTVSFSGSTMTGDVTMAGARLEGSLRFGDRCHVGGVTNVAGATVRGTLEMDGATLAGADHRGVALDGAGVTVGGPVLLGAGFTTERGAVRLFRSGMDGLQMNGATLAGADNDGVALDAAGMTAGPVLLRGFEAVNGAVRLYDARIGMLDLDDATVSGLDPRGIALDGEAMTAGPVLLRGFRAEQGAVRLFHARIGMLEMDGATVSGADGDGIAVNGEGMTVEGPVYLRNGFRAQRGAVRLLQARIGTLDMNDAALAGADDRGIALDGEGMTVEGPVLLGAGFVAERGAVRLFRSSMDGLQMDGATVSGATENGIALDGEGMTVEGPVYLRRGFMAERGAVRLYHARIGTLEMDGATVSGADTNGVAFDGVAMTVEGPALLRHGFTAEERVVALEGSRCAGRLDLTGATGIGGLVLRDAHCGEYADAQDAWPSTGRLELEGFSFDRLDDGEDVDRLEWVRRQGLESWSTDPYEQLAALYARTGDEAGARRVRISRNWDELAAMKQRMIAMPGRGRDWWAGWWTRLWRRPFGWLLGFGYRRWPAGLLLMLVVGAAWFVFWRLDTVGVMVSTAPASMTGVECGAAYECFEPVVYGADVVLPIIDFGQDSAWRPDSTVAWGTFGVWFRWVAIAVGWVLASIFVAAFTRLVRSD